MKPNEFGQNVVPMFFANWTDTSWMDVELGYTGTKALKNMDKYRVKRNKANMVARASRRANR